MKNLIKNIIKNIDILFFVISSFIFLLSFLTDRNVFDFKSLNIINYVCVKILYLIFITILFQFIAKAKNGDKSVKKYIKYFVIYMIPVIILLILIWPGFFFGDDAINFTNLAVKGEFLYYLNYLSSIFYMIGYMFFPCICGPTILLCCLFGTFFSYLLKNLKDLYNSKYVYLIILPFVMFHVICYMSFANRPIMYGLFYAFLISFLILEYLKKSSLNFRKILFISFFASLVGFWRSESIYLIIAVPVFVFIIYKVKINFKNLIKIFGLCFLFFILISLPQKIHDYNEVTEGPHSRNLPSFISPLSVMLVDNLKGSNLEKDIENINKVLDVDSMRKYTSYYDVPCVWQTPSCIKHYNDDDYKKFLKSTINIIKNNPFKFLKAKSLTFMVATASGGDNFSNINTLLSNDDTIGGIKGTSPILSYKIRQKIYTVLEGRTNNTFINYIIHFTNSLLVAFLLIFIVLIESIRKRKLLFFLISSMLICHSVILFFTAPASYFMYYFNVFLTGFILFVIMIIDKFSKSCEI